MLILVIIFTYLYGLVIQVIYLLFKGFYIILSFYHVLVWNRPQLTTHLQSQIATPVLRLTQESKLDSKTPV